GSRSRQCRSGDLYAALRIVGAVRVYIQIDVFNAFLCLRVSGTGAPRTFPEPDVAHLFQEEAFPFSFGRQARLAFAIKLKSECFLLYFGMTEDNGTEFTAIPVVLADDLLAVAHCPGE